MVHGINAYRFKMPEEVMDSSREENKGFCNPTEKVSSQICSLLIFRGWDDL